MKPSTASVLEWLQARGKRGLSPREARMWAGCDRLAARVLELRAAGYEIETRRESEDGSSYARYVLLPSPVAAPLRGVQASFDLPVSPPALPLSGGRAVRDAEGASTAVTGR